MESIQHLIDKLEPYTVILLYPDYIASNYGQETYTAWVQAQTVKDAILSAQAEAFRENNTYASNEVSDLEDFFVLAVFEGHHKHLEERKGDV